MQLHECLLLAAHPPTEDERGSMLNPNNNNSPEDELRGYPEQLFTNASTTTSTQLPSLPPKYTQGSVLSMLKCIVHEWGTNSRTNFYIPPEHYAGYTYLCDECQPSGWGLWTSSSARNTAHCNTRSNCHGHHPSAFVHAEQLHNLHPHHHDNSWYYSMMMMRANATTTATQLLHKASMTPSVPHSPIAMTSLANNDSFHHVGVYLYHQIRTVPTTTTAPQSASNLHIDVSSLMTTPYIHPSLELPVPPLHLPWYFGTLCWSFALAGVLMLRLPQKWTLHGGSRRCMQRKQHQHGNHGQLVESSRHWFPYRAFAWVLILWQSPCSFLADYVHMTNVSAWHVIDRFTACTMMSLELVKLITMRPYTRPAIYILYLMSCGIAMYCFLKGQKSLQMLSENGFVFWHSGWHCYPIIASIVYLVEYALNQRWGEYYKFGCDDAGEDHSGHVNHQERCTDAMKETATSEPIKVNREQYHHGDSIVSSGTDGNSTSAPTTSRRSRRIAGLKPAKYCCL